MKELNNGFYKEYIMKDYHHTVWFIRYAAYSIDNVLIQYRSSLLWPDCNRLFSGEIQGAYWWKNEKIRGLDMSYGPYVIMDMIYDLFAGRKDVERN